MVVRAKRVVVVTVRVVALVQEALLRLVGAGRGGVETELVAVLALLVELLGVAANDHDDIWMRMMGASASLFAFGRGLEHIKSPGVTTAGHARRRQSSGIAG